MGFRGTARPAIWARAIAAGAMVLLCAQAVEAASCTNLKSELRRLESGAATQSPAAQKWSTAKRQQQKALSAAERDAGYFGCATAGSSQCKSLNSKIKRMRANLRAIERQLTKSSGGARNSKRVRQVRAAIKRQNCNQPAATRRADSRNRAGDDKPRSLLSRLFNPQPRAESVAAKPGDQEIATVRRQKRNGTSARSLPSGGKFRTLCVRTCDGYFFPVSYSIGKRQFAYDEARCSEICPAAETELYVYRNPGGNQSDMMSLAGELYTEQPFANRYKSEFVEGCSCRLNRKSKRPSAWTELSTVSGNRVFVSDISAGLPRRSLQPSRGSTFEDEGRAASPLARAPLTRQQLPRYEDPDTLFNLEKGFDVSARLSLAAARVGTGQDTIATGYDLRDGLPVLSLPSRQESDDPEVAAIAPVFENGDDGFREAPDSRSAVRVVGPEYFVAQ